MNPPTTMPADYSAGRIALHWAAQLPPATSTLLDPVADYSHTTLDVIDGGLAAQPMTTGERVALDAALTLHCGDAALPLAGKTVDEGLAFLRERLGDKVERPPHDLPERALELPFAPHPAYAAALAWFTLADRVLDDVARVEGGEPVRLWPHHFDIATLIELDKGAPDPEHARSMNVGLSPGDGSIGEPYWYVTPWPKPPGDLPSLERGRWFTEGFCAAVYPASQHGADTVEADARAFVRDAVSACRTLLRDERD